MSVTPPASELAAEEAAALAHEGKTALQKMGEAEIKPSTPFDIGSKHIPDPGGTVGVRTSAALSLLIFFISDQIRGTLARDSKSHEYIAFNSGKHAAWIREKQKTVHSNGLCELFL